MTKLQEVQRNYKLKKRCDTSHNLSPNDMQVGMLKKIVGSARISLNVEMKCTNILD